MNIVKTHIPGLLIFEPKVFGDNRGFFFESFSERVLIDNNINIRFVQDNQSSSCYGVIRGLHYQLPPHAQTKMVRVLEGSVLDVVVDIRKGSPTYGEAYSIELSAENKKQLFVPAGFAHGFSVLSEKAQLFYKCDAFYSKESEGGISFKDPALKIDWKIPTDKAIISEKDKVLPDLKDCKNTFEFKG
jgi:dTDP-4-dehydrorhamnose 3,5-epimerase